MIGVDRGWASTLVRSFRAVNEYFYAKIVVVLSNVSEVKDSEGDNNTVVLRLSNRS